MYVDKLVVVTVGFSDNYMRHSRKKSPLAALSMCFYESYHLCVSLVIFMVID